MPDSSLLSKWLGTGVPYEETLQLQDQLVAERFANPDPLQPDTLFLLEHAPAYTIGRLRDQSSLGPIDQLPHPLFEINRGGQATYHGPGQLVGYPIVDLTRCGNDLHRYLRLLEDIVIATLADFHIAAQRREGLTGVWVEHRKIASIGVGVRKWTAMHGFAINVTPECLPGFDPITPCGIDGVQMTCLHHESTARPTTRQVGESAHQHLEAHLAALRSPCRSQPAR